MAKRLDKAQSTGSLRSSAVAAEVLKLMPVVQQAEAEAEALAAAGHDAAADAADAAAEARRLMMNAAAGALALKHDEFEACATELDGFSHPMHY